MSVFFNIEHFYTHFSPEEGDNDTGPVELRHHKRGELRHAMSEVLPNEVRLRKRSQTMANVKEHAYGRLQEELSKAQEVKKHSFLVKFTIFWNMIICLLWNDC